VEIEALSKGNLLDAGKGVRKGGKREGGGRLQKKKKKSSHDPGCKLTRGRCWRKQDGVNGKNREKSTCCSRGLGKGGVAEREAGFGGRVYSWAKTIVSYCDDGGLITALGRGAGRTWGGGKQGGKQAEKRCTDGVRHGT